MLRVMDQRDDVPAVQPSGEHGPQGLSGHDHLAYHRVLLLALVIATALTVRTLAAQEIVTTAGWQEATPGSELETYLRVLQLAGKIPLYPWSVRGFSPQEVDRLAPKDSLHPWAAWLHAPDPSSLRGLRLAALRPDVRLIFNSSFPWAHADGVPWAGRGLTGSLQIGIRGRYGPISFTLDPVIFRAQNDPFALVPNGFQGSGQFRNATTPSTIDAPQRFGSTPYTRLDPGQSTVQIDAFGVALGVSTAGQLWGPGITQQLVLGNQGPGFFHVFVGSSKPVNLWLGHLHARLEIGRLEQSAYSVVPADSGSRLMSAFVATFVPRWTPGLELGVTRFEKQRWHGLHLGDLLIPFQGIFQNQIDLAKKYDPNSPGYTPQSQVASIFARWAFPASGLEAFGEFVRDYRATDLQDFLGEPDHDTGYLLGFMKVVRRRDGSLAAFRCELVNGRITGLERIRSETPLYVHSPIYQGHTNRGVVLGSPMLAGGGSGGTVAMDLYRPDGRWTVEVSRVAYPHLPSQEGAAPGAWEVAYSLRVERLLRQHGWDFTAALTPIYELNHNFARDAFNLRLDIGARVALSGRD